MGSMRAFELALRTRRTETPNFWLRPLTRCAGKVELGELSDWMASKTTCRSVLAAFSAAFFDDEEGKIFALDHAQNVGTSQWWLVMLFNTNTRIAQRFRCDRSRLEFVTADDEAPEWMPGKTFAGDENLDYGDYELRTLPGLQIDAYRCSFSISDDLHAEDDAAVARVHSLLKFGKTGAGRAVFALFRIFEEADYKEKFSSLWYEPPPDLFEPQGEIKAIVAVSPLIVFRLSDVLRRLRRNGNDPQTASSKAHTEAKRQLFEMTIFIARKIRTAADAGCFKLDLTPEDIVFTSTLVQCADEDKFVETGFEHNGRRGMPFVDPSNVRFTQHGRLKEDADCAFIVMMLALLVSVRASYGAMLQHVMMRRLRSQNDDGSPVQENEQSEDYAKFNLEAVARKIKREKRWKHFGNSMKTMLPAYVIARKQVCVEALNEAATDFMDLIDRNAFDPSTRWTGRVDVENGRVAWRVNDHIFSKLTVLTTGRSVVSTALFTLPFAETGEYTSIGEAEIGQLVHARKMRLRRVNI